LSQVDGYLKYESREACQDNEALRSMSMVMSGPYSFGLSSGINNFIGMNILSPSTLHMNSMHNSHLICYFPLNSFYQFYGSNGIFYDRIEAWLEESYSSNVPMNYHCHIFNMVNRFYHASIFPTFTLSLFQVLFLIFCLEHMFAGLGLQGWLH
jgi:hypothetical protein